MRTRRRQSQDGGNGTEAITSDLSSRSVLESPWHRVLIGRAISSSPSFPARSRFSRRPREREKISFHQLNKATGHRIKYRKVDADTGDEVETKDIVKGYEVGKGEYIELDPDELEAVAIEQQAHDRDRRVRAEEGDRRALPRTAPYYIVPDGEVGAAGLRGDPRGDPQGRHGRDRQGGVHLARARHRARGARQGHAGRDAALPLRGAQGSEYFDDIPDEKIPKDMLELA